MIKKIISTLLSVSMMVSLVSVANAADTAGNLVNIARDKTYTSFNTDDRFDDPSPLFDGQYNNLFEVLWDGNVDIGYIIDLGKEYNVEAFKIWGCPGYGSRENITIEYANDPNGPWTNVLQRTSGGDSFSDLSVDYLIVDGFGTATCRYVKLQTYSYAIWSEFEIFAVSDDTSDDNTGNTPGTTPDGNPANTPSVESTVTLGDTSDSIPSDLKNISVGKGIDYDVTGGKPCTYPKENLVDGDTANLSELHMAQGPDVLYPALVVDLGQEYPVSEIRLYAVNNRSEGRNQIWIDYSADGVNWYNVCATDSDTEAAGFVDLSKDVLIINNFGAPNARYVRMKTFSYALMSELAVFVEKPKLNDLTISGRTLTSEFSQSINPATVTADSFKVYADSVLLTLDTHYSLTVSGANVVVTLNKDYYDTEFKVEATTAIKNMIGDALTELTTDTVMAPPAVGISGFEILPPDGSGNVVINANITNNTSTETTSAFMFVYFLDANNNVLDSDIWSDDEINAGGNETPQLTISTSGITQGSKIKAFLWKDLKSMQVWTQAQNLNLN